MRMVVLNDVFRPNQFAGRQIEAVQKARRAERISTVAVDGRRGTWAFASNGGVIMRTVCMRPPFFAGQQIVTNNQFVFAALLLGNGEIASHGETGPGRADRLAPEFFRRLSLPIPRQDRPVQ